MSIRDTIERWRAEFRQGVADVSGGGNRARTAEYQWADTQYYQPSGPAAPPNIYDYQAWEEGRRRREGGDFFSGLFGGNAAPFEPAPPHDPLLFEPLLKLCEDQEKLCEEQKAQLAALADELTRTAAVFTFSPQVRKALAKVLHPDTGGSTAIFQAMETVFASIEKPQQGRIPVRRGEWGELLVDGSANGAPFTFELDTGAYDFLFGVNHAAALGFGARQLSFDGQFVSPGGSGRKALIRLRELRLDGGFVVAGLDAAVNEREMSKPLLGRPALRCLNLAYVRDCCALSF